MTLHIGLSGGIGSGKSTASAQLASLGAVVVDADTVAREVVEPGTPGLAAVAERFGPGVIRADGSLDRPALAELVFADDAARTDLERITHPLIRRRSAALMDAAPSGAVVVHDIPLLVEMGLVGDYALTVMVDVPEAERVRRLVAQRGMTVAAARARSAAQASDEERAWAADVLLDNTGSLADLEERVERLWHDRLLPYEENLRSGRVTERIPAPTQVPHASGPGLAERSAQRLRAALGEDLLSLSSLDSEASGADLALDLRAVVRHPDLLDRPEVRDRLARRGLLPATAHDRPDPQHTASSGTAGSTRWIGTADPALVLRCELRTMAPGGPADDGVDGDHHRP